MQRPTETIGELGRLCPRGCSYPVSCHAQLIHEHYAISLLRTAVMAAGRDRAMKVEVGKNDCFRVLLIDRLPKFREGALDRCKII